MVVQKIIQIEQEFRLILGFMLKKNMKFNPIQGSTKKKYFKIVRL